MKRRNTILGLCGLFLCIIGWSVYVASNGVFYFPPVGLLCDGETGVIRLHNNAFDGYSAHDWSIHATFVATATKETNDLYAVTDRGKVIARLEIHRRPFWILWRVLPETGQSNGLRVGVPCFWPIHFLGAKKASQPAGGRDGVPAAQHP